MTELPSISQHNEEAISAVNEPFLATIRYHADDYSTLRHKLLQHLQEAFPHWNADLAENVGQKDMAAAFAELFSYMADILGFYQDRRANEAFLRTAVLPASLIELAYLINYQLAPGVSAGALQAFILKKDQTGTIPAGFRVSSKAADGKPSFIFETARQLTASWQHNKLYLAGYNRSHRKINHPAAQTSVTLDQGYDGLKAGSFAIFCDASHPSGSIQYYPLQLTAVTKEEDYSVIHWEQGELTAQLPIADLEILGKPKQKMFLAAKARADEITVGQTQIAVASMGIFTVGRSVLFVSEGLMLPARVIAIDSTHKKITINNGFNVSLRKSSTTIHKGVSVGSTTTVLRRGATQITRARTIFGGYSQNPEAGDYLLISDAVGVEMVSVANRDGYTIYLATPLPRAFHPTVHQNDTDGIARVRLFRVRLPSSSISPSTTIKPTTLGDLPSVSYGGKTYLRLDKTYEGIEPDTRLVLADNKHSPATFAVHSTQIEDEQTLVVLNGSVETNLEVATLAIHGPFEHNMYVRDYDRSELSTSALISNITLHGTVKGLKPGDFLAIDGGGHAEGMRVVSIELSSGNTLIGLEGQLKKTYPLASTIVYGNVVPVTHGATVLSEVLGSGDQSQQNLRFTLKGRPTTYIHDAEGRRGIGNTLEVFVSDEKWQEVETLADSDPDERHYVVDIDEDQQMSVIFGDGHHGAAPTTGNDNIVVRYRIGIGADANVPAGTINKVPAPLDFIDSTLNPIAAAGGADRESEEDTKQIAPMTVRTLDRAVSLSDYADLALTYAGIAKARADWAWEEGRRIIIVTVAGSGGNALNTEQLKDLLQYLDVRRSPHHRVRLRNYRPWAVYLGIEIHIKPEFLKTETEVRVSQALGSALDENGEFGYFHFERRGLDEDLYLSDIYALVENVRGVDYAVAKVFAHQSSSQTPTGVMDRIRVPADALATGGHETDATVGVLSVKGIGGIV